MKKNKIKNSNKRSKSNAVNDFLNKKIVPILQIVSANKFLRSLMSGFYTALPIIIFSSIIGIIMWVPPAFAGNPTMYPLELRRALNRIFSFTMGLISLFFCAGVSKTMAEKINTTLPVGRKMNTTMVMFAAISALFMMSVTGTFAINPDGSRTENFTNLIVDNLAAKGMLTGIIVGLSLPWIFSIPVRYEWTIKLPKGVPQGVSQAFSDIIPLGLSILTYWGFSYIFVYTMKEPFTSALFTAIKPVFSGLDSYGFLVGITILTSLIWFIGVHGPSVTRPFLTAFMYTNLANNQQVYAQGGHPVMALTYEFAYDFTQTLGGTGATFVVPTLLIIFARSKQLKAVGFASYIPIWFQVNEPALFGCPLILNPIILPAFLLAPIFNIILYKFFIVNLGMNAAIVDVPWSIPAIVGLMLGTGLKQWQPVLLWSSMCLIDLIIWLPFLILYDRIVCKQEIDFSKEKGMELPLHFNYFTLIKLWFGKHMLFDKTKKAKCNSQLGEIRLDIKTAKEKNKQQKLEAKKLDKEEKLAKKQAKKLKNKKTDNSNIKNQDVKIKNKSQYAVLSVCYGAGTSAMFAHSAERGAIKRKISNVQFWSAAYGNHQDLLKQCDLVIFSPQSKVYSREINVDIKQLNVKVKFATGEEYIKCTNDPDYAIDYISKLLPEILTKKDE